MNKCAVAFGILVCLTAVAPGRAGNQAEPEKRTAKRRRNGSRKRERWLWSISETPLPIRLLSPLTRCIKPRKGRKKATRARA